MINYLHGVLGPLAVANNQMLVIQRKCRLLHILVMVHAEHGGYVECQSVVLDRLGVAVRYWAAQTSSFMSLQPTAPAPVGNAYTPLSGVALDTDDDLELIPGDRIMLPVTNGAGGTSSGSVTLKVDEGLDLREDSPKFPDTRGHWLASCWGLDQTEGGENDDSVPRW